MTVRRRSTLESRHLASTRMPSCLLEVTPAATRDRLGDRLGVHLARGDEFLHQAQADHRMVPAAVWFASRASAGGDSGIWPPSLTQSHARARLLALDAAAGGLPLRAGPRGALVGFQPRTDCRRVRSASCRFSSGGNAPRAAKAGDGGVMDGIRPRAGTGPGLRAKLRTARRILRAGLGEGATWRSGRVIGWLLRVDPPFAGRCCAISPARQAVWRAERARVEAGRAGARGCSPAGIRTASGRGASGRPISPARRGRGELDRDGACLTQLRDFGLDGFGLSPAHGRARRGNARWEEGSRPLLAGGEVENASMAAPWRPAPISAPMSRASWRLASASPMAAMEFHERRNRSAVVLPQHDQRARRIAGLRRALSGSAALRAQLRRRGLPARERHLFRRLSTGATADALPAAPAIRPLAVTRCRGLDYFRAAGRWARIAPDPLAGGRLRSAGCASAGARTTGRSTGPRQGHVWFAVDAHRVRRAGSRSPALRRCSDGQDRMTNPPV